MMMLQDERELLKRSIQKSSGNLIKSFYIIILFPLGKPGSIIERIDVVSPKERTKKSKRDAEDCKETSNLNHASPSPTPIVERKYHITPRVPNTYSLPVNNSLK